MALLHNTVIQSAMLGRRMAGTEGIIPLAGLSRMERKNWYAGGHTPDKKSGVVDGCLPPATWTMPRVSGGMSSRNFANMAVTPAASGALGLPAEGSVLFTIDFAPAAGGLISSGDGTASFAITTTATVLATRSGDGSASMSFTTNTPLLGALGWATATGEFSVSTTMQTYARGYMTGSTIDTSTIVNANIVSVNGYSVTGNGQTGSEWGPA